MNLQLLLLAPTKVFLSFTFFHPARNHPRTRGGHHGLPTGQSVQAAINRCSTPPAMSIAGSYNEDLSD